MLKDIYYYFDFPRTPEKVVERLTYKFRDHSIRWAIRSDFQKLTKLQSLEEERQTMTLIKMMTVEFVFAYYYFLNMGQNNLDVDTCAFYTDTALKIKTAFAEFRKSQGQGAQDIAIIQKVMDEDIEYCAEIIQSYDEKLRQAAGLEKYLRATAFLLFAWLRDGKLKRKDELADNTQDFMIGTFGILNGIFKRTFKSHWGLFMDGTTKAFKETFGIKG